MSSTSLVGPHIEAARSRALAVSRALHADPELAFVEHNSAAILREWLAEEGFAVQSPVAGMDTAFVATIGERGPHIAVMAEYDALPGLGHGCGHNLIAAGGVLAGIAAAAALKASGMPGRLSVIGTPAEEGGGGKALELEAGVFDDVDAALMFHPSDRTVLDRRMLACIHLHVTFHGLAAHAAKNPEQGRNALAAMILFFNGVDALRQHSGDGSRMHGIITNGGTAPNVVPDLTEAVFIVRDATLAGAEALVARVTDAAAGAALITGTTAETTRTGPAYAHLESNEPMVDRLRQHMDALGEPVEPASPSDATGSTDAGNVSLALPTVHPFIAIAPRGTPSHSLAFAEAAVTDQAHDAMVTMSTALAALAWDLVNEPDLLSEARDARHPAGVSPIHD